MEIRLIDETLKPVEVIDVFTSFIWTDRFYECGDFELKLPIECRPEKMVIGAYLTYDKSEHVMIIENLQLDRSAEEGNILTVSGRSLEALLDRRVIYEYIYYKSDSSNGLENYIELLLKNAIISPAKSYRKIPNLVFEKSGISSPAIEAQHQGCGLYDTVCGLCRNAGIGWKITVKDDNFVFQLYNGIDHSSLQKANRAVVFSERMDTLSEVQYLESMTDFRNAALIVGGEDADVGKVCTDINANEDEARATGLNRREIAVENGSRRKTANDKGETVTLTENQYKTVLQNAGLDELALHAVTRTTNGKVDSAVGQFKYGTDFVLGDWVTVDTGLADSTTARVVEATFSEDINGFEMYNSFETVDLN